jgi:purine nucleosidase
MSRPFFIDTDTASDDAVALVMAFRYPDVEVVGIGVVAGNVPLDQVVQNALYTREVCGVDVPVHVGAAGPLEVPLHTAQHVHGADGMGDIGLALSGRRPDEGHAVDALLDASHRYAGELELVTLGPLTNIALAIQKDPSLPERVRRCITMGAAADHIGNMSPVAEFNMWADPHAVDVVLRSGMPIEFVGWDVSRRDAVFTPAQADDLRAIGTPIAEFCVDIQKQVIEFCVHTTKLAGFDMPDPIAMAVALDPTVALEVRRIHCAVETESTLTFGMVVMDVLGFRPHLANADVVMHADRQKFEEILRAAIS